MSLASPLLETKFYAPRPRRGLVPRPRLRERLSRGTESRLTLISAPAGFGKSTLLAEWLAAATVDGRKVAWLSLDHGDNQSASFWAYLVAALQAVAPGVGASAMTLLRELQPPPLETVLSILLNELGATATDIVLVLDDYHEVDGHDIQVGMAFLLEHLPPQLHLVMATRADPVLPLARLRARGELVEIRAVDLRFTPDEAAAYLNGVMGLTLTGEDVAALERRTEGWIAALQLAALSMQGRDDVAGFIAGFTGDDRYIVDYLVEEVLQRQAGDVRSFLLQTSILGRLSGPLCDAVCGHDGGKAMLEALDRRNLFLVPLDDRRQWYRYQHLFADVLQARLLDERREEVPELHRRASSWYEQNGERAEAIRHSLAAGDHPRAADLAELALPDLRRDRQSAALLEWLERLPIEVIRARPVLSTAYAWSLLEAGRLDAAEAALRDAEGWLAAPVEAGGTGMVVVNGQEFRDLPATLALYRAGLAQSRGDVAETMRYARLVLELSPGDEHLRPGSAAALLGLAYWTNGDLEAAHRSFAQGMANLEKAGYLSDAISGAMVLADLRITQGRLHDAARTYEQALQIATRQGEPLLRGTPDIHVGLSELYREHDDLDGAMQELLTSRELGERTGLPQARDRWCLAMARVKEAQGDLDGALELVLEAERHHIRNHFFPDVRPLGAVRARLWVVQGRLAEAAGWVRAQGLSAAEDVTYVREFEHITLSRLLLAQGTRERADDGVGEAADLLGRLLVAADAGGRQGSAIEILVLQALAQQAAGDTAAARVALTRALRLAEPEGYARVFIDEGPPMAALLKLTARQPDTAGYARRLIAALAAPDGQARVQQPLIEPLSERELEVLRLLGSDLDGPDIARQLTLSLATVRTHTRNIYAKLGVNSRREAVRRATELGLLSRARDPRATA